MRKQKKLDCKFVNNVPRGGSVTLHPGIFLVIESRTLIFFPPADLSFFFFKVSEFLLINDIN